MQCIERDFRECGKSNSLINNYDIVQEHDSCLSLPVATRRHNGTAQLYGEAPKTPASRKIHQILGLSRWMEGVAYLANLCCQECLRSNEVD